jgi:predicted dehydrogenase
VLRTAERAAQVAEQEHVFATADLEEALKTGPDFAVLCVPRAIVKDYMTRLMERNIPVLCETPPGKDVQALKDLWQEVCRCRGRVQVLEQYFVQPYYASVLTLIEQGYLGEISQVMLSALHGYHAISMYRKLLGTGYENCTIEGRKFPYQVTRTNGRGGFDTSGDVIQSERSWASLRFDSGKTAFFDFSSEQYFSMIRTRRWNIQGVRGEINDDTVRFLNAENLPVEQKLCRMDVGLNNNSEWAHKCMMFLDQQVYSNPFYPARLNDDEIAVATGLAAMKEYVETGREFYSLRDALQDAYLAFEMDRALESGQAVHTESQMWAPGNAD